MPYLSTPRNGFALVGCLLVSCWAQFASAQTSPITNPSNVAISEQELPQSSTPEDDRRKSVLWMQKSLEYRLACIQAYRSAEPLLRAAMCNRNWTASTEQQRLGNFQFKPPAIILDVDETVLDNSPFNAQLVAENQKFSPDAWNAWCNKADAQLVPGAAHFLQHARQAGVAVFFVSNRDAALKTCTRQNLSNRLGIAIADRQLLFKNERPEWTRDKSSRREHVAATHRILLLVGDDFNDFVKLAGLPNTRNATGLQHQGRLGRSWILLPNPIYGSWESAL